MDYVALFVLNDLELQKQAFAVARASELPVLAKVMRQRLLCSLLALPYAGGDVSRLSLSPNISSQASENIPKSFWDSSLELYKNQFCH